MGVTGDERDFSSVKEIQAFIKQDIFNMSNVDELLIAFVEICAY